MSNYKIISDSQNEIETKNEKEKINKIKITEFEYPAKYKYIFFILFLLLGLINNLGYVLILTGSQQFSSKLKSESLIACYPLALISFSSISRFINSKFCIKISYTKRLFFLSLYFFLFIVYNSFNIQQKRDNCFFSHINSHNYYGNWHKFRRSNDFGLH